MRRIRFCFAVAALGCVMIGCSPPQATTTPQAGVGVSIGEIAPEINGYDLTGESLRLSDLRGKVVLLDFWQSNCPPCREFHQIEHVLIEKFGTERFVVVGVNLDSDRQRGLRSQQREEIPWRSFHDSKGFISLQWRVRATPTVYLIDQQGVIRYFEEGAAPIDALETRIAKMLAGGKL